MMKNKIFYDIAEDIKNNEEAFIFIAIGGRATGKTYGALKDCLVNKRRFVFVKRTISDVELLCAGSKADTIGADFSPFKSINNDMYTNVKAKMIDKKAGVGAFYHCDKEDDTPQGLPIGYIIALSAVTKVKGFDLSDCEWLIFDEFIPQPWERGTREEGKQILDLYMTINRAREIKGLEPLKLIALANATEISNPLMRVLEVTDIVADIVTDASSDCEYIDIERGIYIHVLQDNNAFRERMHMTKIYKCMSNTSWGKMAFENQFAYNDFSNVKKLNFNKFKPVTSLSFEGKNWFIYMKDGKYYMSQSGDRNKIEFNLSKENDQKRFYDEYIHELREYCINDCMRFEKYTAYDLIMNYKTYFRL